jgi:phosphatidylinositol-3-phosphatase
VAGAALAAALVHSAAAPVAPAAAAVPHVKHVFIVILENEDAAKTFGRATEVPYLGRTLKSRGAFIPNYYAIGHLSLSNYIAMVSGQAPTPENQADCQGYNDILPGTQTSSGQVIGDGCVYPPGIITIANQLEGEGYTWRGYMQDMAAKAPNEPSSCRHPDLNSQDDTQTAEAGDQYAARHNPFVYFHAIIDLPTCAQNDVDLSRLAVDLRRKATTPDYSFITPDLCNDGHDAPCVDGGPGGMVQANAFLRRLVPMIRRSAGFKDRGLLLVTFDEAEGGTSPGDDGSACCDEPTGPNTPFPGALTGGPGGGRIGAVMLSPCIRPGTVSIDPYNHYSMLRSFENNFGLTHLGYAGQEGLKPFDAMILNKPVCGQRIRLRVRPRRAEVGQPTTFRFRVRSSYRPCRRHVTIRFAGHRLRTGRHGRAKLRLRFGLSGHHVAVARRSGCVKGRVRVGVHSG